MSRVDDAEIMKRLQNDDQSALAIVLRDVVPTLWPLLIQKFRESLTHEDIEDIVATSLSKLWQNRHKFDIGKGDFNGWLYVILRNTALDFLRRRMAKAEETLIVVPVSEASTADEIEKEHALRKAVSVLSQREQQVILPLFDHSGTSVAQLGESLSLSSGAVRQLRFRALRRLENALRSAGFAVKRVRMLAKDDLHQG